MLAYRHFALGAVVACGLKGAALAQDTPRATQPPVLPSPQNNSTIPEKILPSEPSTTGSTGGTLSDKLEASDGVIRPPSDVTPDMRVPGPVPNPGTMPVIPPPARSDPK